jgi:uncharacterized membrane protein (UPF0127 family)
MTPMSLVALNLDTGSVVADRVSVAATRAARRVGLLNRSSLEPGEALWIVPSRGVHTMWMRFAIDLIALDELGVVIDCVEALRPWRVRLPRAGTAGVLELPVGALEQSGTALGHRIQFERRASREQGHSTFPHDQEEKSSVPVYEPPVAVGSHS